MPKKQSKRVPLRRKYSIESKVKEHNRKAKRDAKKNPNARKKLRKDPGIPNLNPFKAAIVHRLAEQQKLLKFEATQRARRAQEVAARRRAAGDAGEGTEDGGLAGLAADAAARGKVFDSAGAAAEAAILAYGGPSVAADPTSAAVARAGNTNRRAFYRQLKQLLDKADVLVEVLDARDPLGSRSPALEALALSMEPPKRIVLVLNKVDLVPPAVTRAWLAHLRKDFPTVAFKASTQAQSDNLSARGGAAVNKALEQGQVLTGSGAAGTDTLLQLLKNYSRSAGGGGVKSSLTVGVVGFPNVGKSSLINSLKRSKAVGVSATAGSTRVLQEVAVDSKITVIDSPGVIFDDGSAGDVSGSGGSESGGHSLLLRNVLSVDAISDPEAAVEGILGRCRPEALMRIYAIPAFDDAAQFLAHIALRRGKLSKGGVPNRADAARSVLQDWQAGRIPFFVAPPGFSDGGASDDSQEGGDEEMGSAASSSSSSAAAAAAAQPAAKGKKASASASSSSSSGLGKAAVSRDLGDVGSAAILTASSSSSASGSKGQGGGGDEQPAFDLEGLFREADAALQLGPNAPSHGSSSSSALSGSSGSNSFLSVSGAGKLNSAAVSAAAKKLAAKVAAAEAGEPLSDDEDEGMDGGDGDDDSEDDEEMGEEGDSDDEDELEDDDDDDEMDEEEEDDEAPPAPVARRGTAVAAGGKKGGKTSRSSASSAGRVAGAAAVQALLRGSGKAAKGRDSYDFNEHFK